MVADQQTLVYNVRGTNISDWQQSYPSGQPRVPLAAFRGSQVPVATLLNVISLTV